MGIFDLPAPLLSWLEGGLGAIAPPTRRLILSKNVLSCDAAFRGWKEGVSDETSRVVHADDRREFS